MDNFNKDRKENNMIRHVSYGAPDVPMIPEYVEFDRNNNSWINWGVDNLYPDFLLKLYQSAPLHSAIIDLKASMIGSSGFIDANWDSETIDFINNGKSKYDLETIIEKLSLDYVIFNGYSLIITYTKEGDKIARIDHISPSNIRVDKEKYYVANSWRDVKLGKEQPVIYRPYDFDNRKGSCIYYHMNHRGMNNYYPIPEYTPALTLIQTQVQINDYHLHTINNQFNPSFHINFVGNPSPEEADENDERIREYLQGAKKAGNAWITYCEDIAKKATIEPIPTNDSDKKYSELSKSVMEGIIAAHNVNDRKLFGYEISGELGGKNDRLESLSMFQTNYVSKQQNIIEKQFNEFGRINGLVDKLKLKNYTSNLSPTMPPAEMLSILTSTISTNAKISMLVNYGYDRDTAQLLVDNKNDTIGDEPTTEIID